MKKNSHYWNSKQACDSICSVAPQTQVTVISIDAGCQAKTRLNHLGLLPGTQITIQSVAPFNGPIQVKLRNTMLCIGRGLAQKIKVEIIR